MGPHPRPPGTCLWNLVCVWAKQRGGPFRLGGLMGGWQADWTEGAAGTRAAGPGEGRGQPQLSSFLAPDVCKVFYSHDLVQSLASLCEVESRGPSYRHKR